MSLASDDEERIRRAREVLKTIPVRLHHFPGWLRTPTMNVFKQLPDPKPRQIDFPIQRLRYCLKALGAESDLSLDHWGSWQTPTDEGLCGEPYATAFRPADLDVWKRFAEMAGLRCTFSTNSWWNPGSTLRIGVYRRREAAR